MTFWYLASPYRECPAGREYARRETSCAAAQLAKAGIPVFSPIVHGSGLVDNSDIDDTDNDFWVTANLPFMQSAYGLILLRLVGWNKSDGVRGELSTFGKAGKPVVEMDWPAPPNTPHHL